MKKSNSLFNRSGFVGIALFALATFFGVTSCRPDYDLDKRFPEWLGTSIFETLQEGFKDTITGKEYKFETYVKLIKDLDQEKILAKTGSKTLFVADDEAFKRFFADCPFTLPEVDPETGKHKKVTSYEQLSVAQKTMILKGSMLNNVYQVAMLSSSEGPKLGDCMRRLSSSSIYDTIPVLLPEDMPNTPLWSYLKNDPNRKAGIPIMVDGTIKPMIFFVNKFLTMKKITDEDYEFLFNLPANSRQANDASVNGVRIACQNKKCFNGFIHVMEDVIYLLPNMAEYLEQSDSSIIFSSILDRFSAPFYPTGAQSGVASGKSHTDDVKRLLDDDDERLVKIGSPALKAAMAASDDSVYTKMYFSKRSQGNTKWNKTPAGKQFGFDGELLKFDPGWNTFFSETSSTTTTDVALQQNMAVMMVPTDNTLMDWWINGAGKALRQRYGLGKYKENPPTNAKEVAEDMSEIDLKVIVKLVNNNMLNSLTGSVPSKFSNVLNDANDPLFEDTELARSQITKVVMCCNGAIYFTNAVYAPTAYRSVSYPALVNEKLQVIDWAIEDEVMSFSAYLNSMVATYSFFIPEVSYSSDLAEELRGKLIWVDPVSFAIKKYGASETEGTYLKALVFSYDDVNKTVKADLYNYNDTTNQILEKTSSQSIDGTTDDGLTYLRNRLEDLLDYHIIIGNVEGDSKNQNVPWDKDGYAYFKTKGRGTVRFKKAADFHDMEVAGGWQIETGQKINIVDRVDLSKESTSHGNGRTYIIDRPLQTSRLSVYDILSDEERYPEFSRFFKLMQSATGSEGKSLFQTDANKHDIGSRYCVSTLNTYHYTIYVPTNESLEALEATGILVDPKDLATYDENWRVIKSNIYDDLYEGDEATANKVWQQQMIEESRRVRGAQDGEPNTKADSTFDFKKDYSDVKRDQLKNFIKYHIQDNSVYANAEFEAGYNADGSKATETNYETAYMRESDKQFAKLKVKGGDEIEVTDANGNVRHVLKNRYSAGVGKRPLWNIMCREYEFNATTVTDASRSRLETSSYIVIHQIDGPLCNGEVKF